jgi:diguanylate cyclase (GGDEF)-like protein
LLDFATGIPNRELFNNRLEQGIAIAQRGDWDLALLFIDLDRFKFINDTFGHPVGDRVLQMVARRLSEQARTEDTICRYGGDEFLYLLLNPKGRKNIQRIAHRIFDHISQPLIIDDLALSIKLSIGIAVYPECGETGAKLISNADIAMYQAKKTKAGIVSYDECTNENLSGSQKKEMVTAEIDMEKERKLFEKFYMEYRGFYKWLFDRDKKNHHRYQAELTNREFDSWLAAAFDSEYGLIMTEAGI